MKQPICRYQELKVYQLAFDTAMDVFQMTKNFPSEERYALVDQVRRSSRSVCANLAEAWRKRRYKPAFIAKLSDCEAEASETMVHLQFSSRCNYIDEATASDLEDRYDHILSQIVRMIETADKWIIKS